MKEKKLNLMKKYDLLKIIQNHYCCRLKNKLMKEYVLGDTKHDYFIYNNTKNYYLIDFNASDKINNKNNNIKIEIATFLYMPPEKNSLTSFYNNKISNVKSDLWSVGIIFLQFISKNKIFSENTKIYSKECEHNSLLQYSKIYGSIKSKIPIEKIIQFNKEYNYKPNFISNNYHREEIEEKENIINLIKSLLKINVDERITIDDALENDFFKNEIDNDYCNYCLDIAKKK